uniref:Uncharacterized protein n=1 Tax=Cannabis sativa TaxID=3483 RepID=A0A803QN83_CANSA
YLGLLAKYPVATKAVTSALLTLVGDLICQIAIDQVPSLDLKRTFLFTLLGLVLVGPTLHFWYFFLSKSVTLQGGSGALLRLLLDQFLFSPIFIGVFLSTLVTLEGRPEQVVPKLQQEWFSAVVANWQLWIPFQFLNFRFVPQQFQKAKYFSLGATNHRGRCCQIWITLIDRVRRHVDGQKWSRKLGFVVAIFPSPPCFDLPESIVVPVLTSIIFLEPVAYFYCAPFFMAPKLRRLGSAMGSTNLAYSLPSPCLSIIWPRIKNRLHFLPKLLHIFPYKVDFTFNCVIFIPNCRTF